MTPFSMGGFFFVVVIMAMTSASSISYEAAGYHLEVDPFRHHQVWTKVDETSRNSHTVLIPVSLGDRPAYKPKSAAPSARAFKGQPYDFVPIYKATLMPKQTTQWEGECFRQTSATLVPSSDGAVVSFQLQDPKSLLCSDFYLIADYFNWHLRLFAFRGLHTLEIKGWKVGESTEVGENGLMIFSIPDEMVGSIVDLVDTIDLFFGKQMVKDNVDWIEGIFERKFDVRSVDVVSLNKSMIHNGDQLSIRRWDGMDPLIMFGTGSLTGHTAITLWEDNELYVWESTGKTNYWPDPWGVIRTPWDRWISQAQAASYEVVLLPLRNDLQRKFDVSKALQFAHQMEGYPYGYRNFLFGWVDTLSGNYPPPLTMEILVPASILVDAIDHKVANMMYLEALNKRLGTRDLSMRGVLDECIDRNITLYELITYPEMDDWVYSDGPAMVCNVFVTKVYKAGGIFGDLQFQATEQVPRDTYSFQIFDVTTPRPAQCQAADPSLPFCQLMGKYRLDLPTFNSIPPYANMNERCAALPPHYTRGPSGC